VAYESPGRWYLGTGQRATPIAVRAEGSWLRVTADLTSAGPGILQSLETLSLLSKSAALPPPLKCGLDSAGTPWLSCDLACVDEEDIRAALQQAVSAVLAALDGWDRPGAQPAEPTASAALTAALPESGSQLADLCQAAGWSAEVRAAGQVAVALEVGGEFHQARAAQLADGTVRLRVDFESEASLPAVCRAATERLLLEASHLLRLVRATAGMVDSLARYRWESLWKEMPSSRQLHHALSALSLACQLTARETAALAEPRVARRYLDQRGLRTREG
jgi:hypothetical protein